LKRRIKINAVWDKKPMLFVPVSRAFRSAFERVSKTIEIDFKAFLTPGDTLCDTWKVMMRACYTLHKNTEGSGRALMFIAKHLPSLQRSIGLYQKTRKLLKLSRPQGSYLVTKICQCVQLCQSESSILRK
jgi:hypothetical protein